MRLHTCLIFRCSSPVLSGFLAQADATHLLGVEYVLPHVISANKDAKNDALTAALIGPDSEAFAAPDSGLFIDYRF